MKVLHDQVLLARRFLSLLGRHGHMWWLRLVVISTTAVSHGWWAGPEGPPEVEPLEEQAGWRQHLREWLPGAERRLNATEEWLAGLASWGRELEGASTWGSWDVALWMVVDTLFGMIGWALFGSAWTKVRTGCRRLLQVLVVLGLCLVAHYVWAVRYPINCVAPDRGLHGDGMATSQSTTRSWGLCFLVPASYRRLSRSL